MTKPLTITLADYDLEVLEKLEKAKKNWENAEFHDNEALLSEIRQLEVELCGIVERLARGARNFGNVVPLGKR